MSSSIARYLRPWALKRTRDAERLSALRSRDGDNCARCRRPLRFDLPAGNDQGAVVETATADEALANSRLCHRRCFAPGMDHTGEVTERMRRRNEAALLSKSRPKKTKAA